jgi:hypothetical protein
MKETKQLRKLMESVMRAEADQAVREDEGSKAFQVATIIFDRYEDDWTHNEDFETVEYEAELVADEYPNATIEELVQVVLERNPELKPTAGASIKKKPAPKKDGKFDPKNPTVNNPFYGR